MKEKFNEILRYRELIESLVIKNFKIRYHGSALGYLWSFLTPFLMMGLYTLVFSFFLRIKVENYPLFLISTMVPWTFFASSVLQGTTSLVSHSEFIKKIYCPREIFPLSLILTNAMVLFIGLIAVIPFMLYFKGSISAAFLLLPIVIFIHFLFICGLALIFCCLHVFYRDVSHVLDFLITFWFYLTPIIYPLSMVPENLQFFFYLNPMFHILTLYREILYGGSVPHFGFFLSSFGISVAVLFGGWKVFLGFEQLVAKEL